QRDIFRFMRENFSLPLREILQKESGLIHHADVKAARIKVRTIRINL
ncbi:lipopolysaccharide core heptose(I) kinase RfaP, partial [Salmonella enterica subsp. enterica serovar Saintpaul]|nr:lipopolysaccharide core heptose(I) kinase RfaP [Salmonella enterica subsp. enterica serovar Saintpaul]